MGKASEGVNLSDPGKTPGAPAFAANPGTYKAANIRNGRGRNGFDGIELW
jgi:hypothetical protein